MSDILTTLSELHRHIQKLELEWANLDTNSQKLRPKTETEVEILWRCNPNHKCTFGHKK